jgi:glucose/arabinose dehydrogenase
LSRRFLVSIGLALFVVIVAVFLSWLILDGRGQTQTANPIEVAYPNLSFNQPVGLYSPNDGTDRVFVVEQPGVIRVFNNSATSMSSSSFLDISTHVVYGGEQGLLGLAFHPNYRFNGYIYVDYVANNPLRTVISRYKVSAVDPNLAQSDSEFVLLEISQPYSNHKGGQLAFGPDGYLYIGMGDGGSEGDPLGNGQNLSTLLGKILRIDVNSPSAGRNYSVPLDNPFVGNTFGYKEEIYAYGFRNPWRFSFDPPTSRLWVGDVGQDRMEEIDLVEKGKNYGWNIMEGTLPYAGGNQTRLELPVSEYSHDIGNAIIGGYVYRGSTTPVLTGVYVYGDYGTGKIWALNLSGTGAPTNTLLTDSGLVISSFGIDARGEIHVCAFDGKIYKFNQNVIPEFSPAAAFAFLLFLAIFWVALTKRKSAIIIDPLRPSSL